MSSIRLNGKFGLKVDKGERLPKSDSKLEVIIYMFYYNANADADAVRHLLSA